MAGVRRLVVAAAIVDELERPTRLLAARRTSPPELAGRWEFPGGKVEPGEDPVAALHREIGEELAVTVVLGSEIVPPDTMAWTLTDALQMRVWLARVDGGAITGSNDHDELRWVGADELKALHWLPGDRPIVDRLELRLATSAAFSHLVPRHADNSPSPRS